MHEALGCTSSLPPQQQQKVLPGTVPPVAPVTQEAKVGEALKPRSFEASLGKHSKNNAPNLKNKTKPKTQGDPGKTQTIGISRTLFSQNFPIEFGECPQLSSRH
jgi:hypothetical protein